MKTDRTTIKDPRNPEYYAEARDAIMDLCPFYDPNHKGGIVREAVFKECLSELRARITVLNDVISSNRATMDTLKEQLKADEKAAYDLRCLLHEVADHCGISTSLWPSAVADRLKQMKDDKDEIETMWEELTKAIGAHGKESDPLTGRDTNADIHKRAMDQIKTMMSDPILRLTSMWTHRQSPPLRNQIKETNHMKTSTQSAMPVAVSRLVRKILCAPAPRWMIRLQLRMTARKLHQCANLMLSIGTDEHYQTAVKIRTLAHSVSDSANSKLSEPKSVDK